MSATLPPLQGDKKNWNWEHPMKNILALSILFSVIALPVLGELSDADLNKIRLIVQEEIKPIKADIVTLKNGWCSCKVRSCKSKRNY